MGAQGEPHETRILETWGIRIKDQYYHLILTNRRIIASGGPDDKPRSVVVEEIRDVETATDGFGDPVLILNAPSVSGEIKKVILHFSRTIFPDAEQQRNIWYTEIGKRIAPQIPRPSGAVIQPDPSTPVFCTRCGKQAFPGSFFCDRCGTRIIFALPVLSPEKRDERLQDRMIHPERSRRIGPEPCEGNSGLHQEGQRTGKTASPPASQRRDIRKKRPVFLLKKSAVILGLSLAGIIVVIAAVVLVTSFGSPGYNLASSGPDGPLPDLSTPATPFSPAGITEIRKETQTTPEQPALTFAPGDPGAVLATYPALFNTGDGAGLHDLLSENMQSRYPAETLNRELATARSDDYVMERILVRDQTIEEDSAVLDADVYWMIHQSPTSRYRKLFLVFEESRWRLDSLILHP
jgi:hypothetical protein